MAREAQTMEEAYKRDYARKGRLEAICRALDQIEDGDMSVGAGRVADELQTYCTEEAARIVRAWD